jgi:beta-lactam-binding protein with PASTA domain
VTVGTGIGGPGVHPPNVIGMTPSNAASAIEAKGLVPEAIILTTGPKNKVREQNPDSSECVALGTSVRYSYRP